MLQHLVLENCLLLSSDTFRLFPALTKLKKLKITRGINLKAEDFSFVFSSDSMQNIEHLDLNGCWNIGEVGLRAITYKLLNLKSLSLKNCKSIQKNDVSYLSKCSKLTFLNLAHTNVDSDNLELLPQYVKNLKEIVIGCDVPLKSILHLQKCLPDLIVVISYSEYHKNEKIFSN